MGHGKLKRFAENETFSCLLQPDASQVLDRREGLSGRGLPLLLRDHEIKGRWNERMFAAPQPIVLELGCGRGEYTIDLALREPSRNYIGVDIKGARLWRGAKYAEEQHLPNVAFLRTRIEFITAFFAPEEVSDICITFPDPQMSSKNSRLTSPMFLERYRKFLRNGGVVRLKTDSRFLHEYTKAVCEANSLEVISCTDDLYANPGLEGGGALYEVKTHYERMFLEQGFKITYLAFRLEHDGPYVNPSSFDAAYWRSVEAPRTTNLRGGTID